MVLDLQPLGQFSDGGAHAARQAFQSQHKLMLAWFQARGSCSLLAERQKAAYLITQLRQRPVIRQGEYFHAADYIVAIRRPLMYIVARYVLTCQSWLFAAGGFCSSGSN